MQALRLRALVLSTTSMASSSPLLNKSSLIVRAANQQQAISNKNNNRTMFMGMRAWMSTAATTTEATPAAAAPQEPQQTASSEAREDLTVPKNLVRFLIGPKGSTLKTLIEKAGGGKVMFNSKVESPTEEVATLTGEAKVVETLKKLLTEEMEKAKVEAAKMGDLPPRQPRGPRDGTDGKPRFNNNSESNYVEEVIVDKFYVGPLIGKQGAVLREMEAISGASISYSDRETTGKDRSAKIRGTPAQVQAAKKLITEKIYAVAEEMRNNGGSRDDGSRPSRSANPRRHVPSPNDVKQVVEVPSEVVGYLIGKGGRGLFEIQDRTSTRLDFARDDHRAGAREVTIYGTEANVAKACDIIQQRVKESYERGPRN